LDRKAVNSGGIVSIGYDPKSKLLEIEFKGGAVYQYSGVPETRYKSLIKASAISSYFQKSIRNWYSCKRII